MKIEIDLSMVPTNTFTAGELNVNVDSFKIKSNDNVEVFAVLNGSDDIIKLLLTIDAIKVYNPLYVYCYIPYMPYSRQDRICNKGEAFSFKVMADLLNSMNVYIYTLDIHNERTKSLIPNLINLPQKHLLDIECYENTIFIAPDKGAYRRTLNLSKEYSRPFIAFEKIRNPLTRQIISIETKALPYMIKDQHCVISDDICDGGRTFMAIAKILKRMGAEKISLYITHAIFSYGSEQIFKAGVDEIICGNHILKSMDMRYIEKGKLKIIDTKKKGV